MNPSPSSFELPTTNDDSDHEIWLLRASSHIDVLGLLNGVTFSMLPDSSAAAANNVLSRFQSKDANHYLLTLGDASELDDLRVLVPDKTYPHRSELIPRGPFEQQIHLASTASCSTNMRENPSVLPNEDVAHKSAVGKPCSGSVDSMRLAYTPVPQKPGLKRRWTMPGGKIRKSHPSALFSAQIQGYAQHDKVLSMENHVSKKKALDVMFQDEEPQKKRHKKGKKKKEKNSKKSSKK